MNWSDLLAALALVFIIEGSLLFASPGGLRRTWESLSRLQDGQLRFGGLVGVIAGLVLLYWVRF